MLRLLAFFVFSLALWAAEYSFVPLKEGKRSHTAYLDSLGAPTVYISTRCPKQGDCWPVVQNGDGRVLKQYGVKESLSVVAAGRYTGAAYLYYAHRYRLGDGYRTDYYLIDHNGRAYRTPNTADVSLDAMLTQEADIYEVTPQGLSLNGRITLPAPATFEYAKITNNPDGKLAAIAIDGAGRVYVSDIKHWRDTGVVLSEHGDRMGILGVYPHEKTLYYSVYKYVNSYNKGLVFGRMTDEGERNASGWLYNSEIRNVGFDPSLYVDKARVIVGAKDSTDDRYVHFSIGISEINDETLQGGRPEHAQGYEEEKDFELLLGAEKAKLSWIADAKVEKDDITYADTDYAISDSLYTGYRVQGRYRTTQLALNYLQNEAEGDARNASQMLNIVVDFNGLFSPQSTLRIVKEHSKVSGTATLRNKIDNTADRVPFETGFDRYGALVMFERGYYFGLDYTRHTMPGMVGFSGASKSIEEAAYDPDLELSAYAIVFGRDTLSYAKRYENNFRRFYIDWAAGIGYTAIDLSGATKRAVEEASGKSINTPGAVAISLALDGGYLYQRRLKNTGGAGITLMAGYRAKGTYLSSGQSDKGDSINSDELALEFARSDLWHGPYVSVNLIY